MGYDYCVLFTRARDAVFEFVEYYKVRDPYARMWLPTNVCPALREVFPDAPLIPVSALNGLAPLGIQLYGYRQIIKSGIIELEIDPLMTGAFGVPIAKHAIISFGREKMVDVGGGGAFLTNDRWVARKMRKRKSAHFPAILADQLRWELGKLREEVDRRRQRIAYWDRHLGDSCIRIPCEQIMPWRVIRRIPKKRDAVVIALRKAGFEVGTNYPPLPGVTDAGAISWGKGVINFFVSDEYNRPHIEGACEIIKRTIGQ